MKHFAETNWGRFGPDGSVERDTRRCIITNQPWQHGGITHRIERTNLFYRFAQGQRRRLTGTDISELDAAVIAAAAEFDAPKPGVRDAIDEADPFDEDALLDGGADDLLDGTPEGDFSAQTTVDLTGGDVIVDENDQAGERPRRTGDEVESEAYAFYDSLTRDELYDLARGRGLSVTTKTNKGELIALLLDDDEALG